MPAAAAIIGFHSLEDRLVKQAMRDWHQAGWLEAFSRKPIRPTAAEERANPARRSRQVALGALCVAKRSALSATERCAPRSE